VKPVNEPQSEAELEAIRRCLERGQLYGSERWVQRTADRLAKEHAAEARTAEQGEGGLKKGGKMSSESTRLSVI
jgi:hypothetical protein